MLRWQDSAICVIDNERSHVRERSQSGDRIGECGSWLEVVEQHSGLVRLRCKNDVIVHIRRRCRLIACRFCTHISGHLDLW